MIALRQWDAVQALRSAGLPGQAWVLQQTKAPRIVLGLALDAMGHDVAADAALDTLRRAVEQQLVAARAETLARMSRARYEATTEECEWCNGDGHGAGPDACHHCDGAGRVRS